MNNTTKRPSGMRHWVLATLALLLTVGAFAQVKTVKGVISDETGMTFPGVNIIVKGTRTGTTSDIDGGFSIQASPEDVLQFSFMGYEGRDVKVGTETNFKVRLDPQASVLDEIVVTGYGVSKKSDLTGAVSSLSSKNLKDYKTSSVMEAMGGQIAGVQITQMDGAPGSGFDIKIRGVGTLNGDAGPMYVVDGFQADNIDYLAISDIESMEVLKDASAAAIYGARAANGVVLITTKSGKVGKPTISYTGSANYRTISKKLDLLNPYEFVKLQVELKPDFANTYYKEGIDPDTGDPYKYQSMDDYIGVGGVDWQSAVFKPTWSQDHNVSIQGGTDMTKYTISYNRYDENGIYKNSGFVKNVAKLRLTQKIVKNITFDATINYVNTDKEGQSTSADGGRFNTLAQILSSRPTGGLKMTDEELLNSNVDPIFLESGESLAQFNPIKQAESVKNSRVSDLWQANASFTWEIIKGLTFKTAGSYRMENIKEETFYGSESREAYRNGETPYGQTLDTKKMAWTNYNNLTYSKKIKKHDFSVMLGQEINYNSTKYLKGQSKNFPFDNLGSDNLGLGALPSLVDSGFEDKTLVSFFGRVTYNYNNRYLATATIRTDGSSVFSDKNKWAWAPSFSFAWRINKEKFMEDVRPVSNLKLRAGWGILGNDRIRNYLSLPLYTPVKYGNGNQLVTALIPKHKPNPDLKWEGSTTINVGVDVGLFRDRINLSADAFIKDTKDLLMEKSLPYVTGFTSQWQNIGSIRNKGIELTLNTVNFDTRGGFRWTTDFNISFIKNTLLSLQPGELYVLQRSGFDSNFRDNDYIAIVGESLGLMYGYKQDGVYQNNDFVVNAVTGEQILRPGLEKNDLLPAGDLKPGAVKYKDVSGPDGKPDGIIDSNDRTVIGNGSPDFFGGMTNTFLYKGFDLSVALQFQVGNDVYNANNQYTSQSQLERTNKTWEVSDRWSAENPNNEIPSTKGQISGSVYSRFIEDGSFLRFKNITLGYTFPEKWMKKVYVSNLRIYLSAQNLFTITNYKGFDPEVSMRSSNPMTPGLDWGAYPRSKVFTFGLDIKI